MIDINTLLAWGATYKKLSAGETIFREGAICSFYHQLVSGSVRWMNIDDDGREFIQYMIEPGESFGELPLFDDKPYAATAIADKECIIIRLHKSAFIDLLKENPETHFAFSALLANRIRFKIFILKEMVHHSPEHRLLSLLNYFKEYKTNICSKCNQVKLTRQQIADLTGLRVETVIRTMRHLHDSGKLKIEKGKVYY